MLKIEKIQDKQEVEVLSQYNCQVNGYTELYQGSSDDCMHDCSQNGKPFYYGSPAY